MRTWWVHYPVFDSCLHPCIRVRPSRCRSIFSYLPLIAFLAVILANPLFYNSFRFVENFLVFYRKLFLLS